MVKFEKVPDVSRKNLYAVIVDGEHIGFVSDATLDLNGCMCTLSYGPAGERAIVFVGFGETEMEAFKGALQNGKEKMEDIMQSVAWLEARV